jgi:glycosyltransferase involved in cell wall biosynthesis
MLLENRPAPSDARVWPEAIALREAGFQVCIISPRGNDPYHEPYVCIDGIYVYRYRLPTGDSPVAYLVEYGIALFMTTWLSGRVWWRHGFSVIHAANPPDIFFLVALLYRPVGVKFVFDHHDVMPEMFQVLFHKQMHRRGAKLVNHLLLAFEWFSYHTADMVIVTNESFRRIAVQRGRVPPDRVFVVRNAPDLEGMQIANKEADLKMGNRFLLAYVGIMGPQDGVEYVLKALDLLVHVRGREDIALALVGDGTARPSLEALARVLKITDHVRFTGWATSDEVVSYLRAADVGISPEPQNVMNDMSTMVKVMEYMAAGLPLVAFDLKETRYTAREAGTYARPNSIEDFATKIEELLDDEARRREMGALGRKRIADHLGWKYSKKELLRAYDSVMP